MIETARVVACFGQRLSASIRPLVIVAALGGFLAPPHPALAQNLVQDPFFTNSLSDYEATGYVGVYQIVDGPKAAGILGPNETADLPV